MDVIEMSRLAARQLRQAQAVLEAYPHLNQLKAVQLDNPLARMQSFACREHELSYIDLIVFYITIRDTQKRDPDARQRLPYQMEVIRREYLLN